MEFNYYEILGVRADASEDDIKSAFKTLAKKYHPDKHAGNTAFEEHFKKINSAYQTLSDKEKRKRYDLKLYYLAMRKNEASRPSTHNPSRTNAYRKKTNHTKKPTSNPLDKKKFRKYTAIVIVAFAAFIAIAIWFYQFMNKTTAKENLREGIAMEADNKPLLALQFYTEAIGFDPTISEAYSRRANLRISLYGDYKGALEDIDQAINKSTQPDYQLYFQKAKLHVKNKEPQKGITDLNDAINLNPKYDSLYFYRAEVNNYLLKNYESSIKDYSKTIQLKKDFKDAWFGKATAEYNLADYKNSLKDFNELISLNPEEGSYYYYRGFTSLKLNDTSKACKDWEEAVNHSFYDAQEAIQMHCKKKQ